MGDFGVWLHGWQPMHWLAFAVFCVSLAISGGLCEVASAIRKPHDKAAG